MALLAPPKGRLMRCTVDGLTPNRSAMTRMPGRPGVARASRIRFSSAGAIGGRPRRFPSLRALEKAAKELTRGRWCAERPPAGPRRQDTGRQGDVPDDG